MTAGSSRLASDLLEPSYLMHNLDPDDTPNAGLSPSRGSLSCLSAVTTALRKVYKHDNSCVDAERPLRVRYRAFRGLLLPKAWPGWSISRLAREKAPGRMWWVLPSCSLVVPISKEDPLAEACDFGCGRLPPSG